MKFRSIVCLVRVHTNCFQISVQSVHPSLLRASFSSLACYTKTEANFANAFVFSLKHVAIPLQAGIREACPLLERCESAVGCLDCRSSRVMPAIQRSIFIFIPLRRRSSSLVAVQHSAP
ncbi:hypothetical protein Y032_0071g594 [Ancylostoma ceylanicum]|uniref:Uncharacterized protein n=1 Tax=Ancylostoma ceylanicum TaxID=53326 RepID=A0A016TWY0_9BILA|nr:hypothetical protein Y032_0071g594 [Ancylostoma ceylanicum]